MKYTSLIVGGIRARRNIILKSHCGHRGSVLKATSGKTISAPPPSSGAGIGGNNRTRESRALEVQHLPLRTNRTTSLYGERGWTFLSPRGYTRRNQ